jgi:hypothetical protein
MTQPPDTLSNYIPLAAVTLVVTLVIWWLIDRHRNRASNPPIPTAKDVATAKDGQTALQEALLHQYLPDAAQRPAGDVAATFGSCLLMLIVVGVGGLVAVAVVLWAWRTVFGMG